MSEAATQRRGTYEKRDIVARPIALGLIAILLAAAGVMVAMRALLAGFELVQERPMPPLNPLARTMRRQLPPEPRLQDDPRKDLEAMLREEDEILQTYGWVDREGGVVRIPIDRAMDLIVERGLLNRGQP